MDICGVLFKDVLRASYCEVAPPLLSAKYLAKD